MISEYRNSDFQIPGFAISNRKNIHVAEPMKLSVGSFHLTIPNGTDPQLLAQTLRIVKELEC